jgi:hypothetical protein
VKLIEERLVSLLPAFLRGYWGTLYGQALGYVLDATQFAGAIAARMRFNDYALGDALGYRGADAGLWRFRTETDSQFESRVVSRWEDWPWIGTADGLVQTYAHVGYTVQIEQVTDDLSPDNYSRFNVYTSGEATPKWGSSLTWDDFVWGWVASTDEVATVRQVAWFAKSAHALPWYFYAIESGTLWGHDEWGGWVYGDASYGAIPLIKRIIWGEFSFDGRGGATWGVRPDEVPTVKG